MSDSTVNIDLTNYKDKFGQRVKPGRYNVVVEDAETDTSSAGNSMINLWLRVLDGGPHEGATIVDRLVLTTNSMFRVVGFMGAIGMPTPRKRLQVNLRQFIGKRLAIDVADGEEYRGTVKSEVRGYMPAEQKAEQQQSDLSEDIDSGVSDDEASEDVDLDSVKL